MRFMGLLLLLTGWLIVLCALLVLPGTAARAAFAVAGVAVEGMGLFFFVRSHLKLRSERD